MNFVANLLYCNFNSEFSPRCQHLCRVSVKRSSWFSRSNVIEISIRCPHHRLSQANRKTLHALEAATIYHIYLIPSFAFSFFLLFTFYSLISGFCIDKTRLSNWLQAFYIMPKCSILRKSIIVLLV